MEQNFGLQSVIKQTTQKLKVLFSASSRKL